MNQNEEKFIHFVQCIEQLNSSWALLHKIKTESMNPLSLYAFRFALIEYSKPYKVSNGENEKIRYKLGPELIPNEYLSLHKLIIDSRDQIHAHSDMGLKEAKLQFYKLQGEWRRQIGQNIITGAELMPRINEIILLIEGTLDNMYAQESILEKELHP